MTAAAAAFPDPDPFERSIQGPGFGWDERASMAMYLLNPSAFDAATVSEFLVQVEADESRCVARRAFMLADLASRDRSDDRWVAEEVGAALRWSPKRAMTEVKNACQLHDALPATFARLAAGEITARQAEIVTEASFRLPDGDAVAVFDAAAAANCPAQSEPQTTRFVNREVIRADPAGAERRHRQAVQDRYVRLTAVEDGMALLTAFLPAPEAVACLQRLDGAARRHRQARRSTSGAPKDPRTLDQLRADLFTHTLLGVGGAARDNAAGAVDKAAATDCASGDPAVGLGASVQVIVSASTLLGQDDEPGWLDRYGPISADTARRIAHDPTGTWRRLVTDPTTGQLTDVGTKRYRPPAAIRRHVELRDGTCRFPYCTHPATGCDLDHVVPFPDGPTNVDNLHAVSRRHHRAKTHTRWRVTLDPDTGETTWTSPLGRKRTTRPPQRWTLPGDTPTKRQPPKPPSERQRPRAHGDEPANNWPPDDPPF